VSVKQQIKNISVYFFSHL